jgi:hypothetical protein
MFKLWSIGHQPAYTLELHLKFKHFNPVDGGKISLQTYESSHKTTQYQNPEGHNLRHKKLNTSEKYFLKFNIHGSVHRSMTQEK